MYNSAVAGASPDMLKNVPLFSGLDKRELEQIAGSMRERSVAAGDVVLEQGAGGAGFFVVESGEGDVTVDGNSVGTVGPGDYFGEIALLTGSDRTATITARTDMHCYGLTPWEFTAMAQKLR